MIGGGVVTRAYQETPYGQPRVWPRTKNKEPFDVQKENEIFLDARHEFLNGNQASTSSTEPKEGQILQMSQRFDQLFQKK